MSKDEIKVERMHNLPVYAVSTYLFKVGLVLWNRFKVYGVKNIPNQGGVLVASNHASFLDPPAVGAGYRKRPVHFMARNTLWNSRFGSWWMDHVGCIPVSRGTGDIRALKVTIKMLQQGKVVSMFPEGTRTEDGELQEAKGGIGFIIEKSACVVIPTYIAGSYESYPKGAKKVKHVKVSITYGKPITQDDFKDLGTGRAAYDQYAALIMQRIADLKRDFNQ